MERVKAIKAEEKINGSIFEQQSHQPKNERRHYLSTIKLKKVLG